MTQRMRRLATLVAVALAGLPSACGRPGGAALTEAERRAVADSVRAVLARGDTAYAQGRPDALAGIYADSGPLVLAADGALVTSRDSILR